MTQALSCRNCGFPYSAHAGRAGRCPIAPDHQVSLGSGLAHAECYLERKEKELSLLIIDLGDSCVVKEEKGQLPTLPEPIDLLTGDNVIVVGLTFAQLREAIDGDKPVPRIEKDLPCGPAYYLQTNSDKMLTIYENEYTALCELAGVEIPIWSGNGTWTSIGVESRNSHLAESFTVWRYER